MTVTCLHDHPSAEPTAKDIERAVAAASARVVRAGQRMTTSRRRTLELLIRAGGPVKAYDLLAQFHPDGRSAKPATVYRALDFLERLGLLHRISSISSYVACSGEEAAHAAAFLICDCCGATREIAAPDSLAMAEAASAKGFTIDRLTLEVHGACADCRVTP